MLQYAALTLFAAGCGGPEQPREPVNLGLLAPPPTSTSEASKATGADDYRRGEQAILSGDFPGAKAALEAALVKQPDRAEAHSYLAAALEQLGDGAGAEAHYKVALSRKPDLVHSLSNLSAFYLDATRFQDCVALLDKPEVLKVGSPELYFNLGLARAGLKDTKGAEAAFRVAISRAPTQVNYRIALAQALGDGGRVPEAASELRAARAQAKNDVAALRLIGATFRELRAAGECVTSFDGLIALKDDGLSRLERGLCKFANKDSSGAAEDLKRALDIDPKLAIAHYWLGVVAMGEKNVAEAKDRLSKYLELDPTGTKAKEAQARLKTLP
jgi:Tfp pilus assembly protein PilF